MIVTSLVLVVVSAVSLVVGVVFTEDLLLINVSIGTALLAALFLVIAVIRGGRRPKPARSATLPGEEGGRPATWQGGGWGGAAPVDQAALSREVAEPVPSYTEQEDAPSVDETAALPPVDEAVFAPPTSSAEPEPTAPVEPPADQPPADQPPAAEPPAAEPPASEPPATQPPTAPPPPVAPPPAAPPPRPGGWAPPPSSTPPGAPGAPPKPPPGSPPPPPRG